MHLKPTIFWRGILVASCCVMPLQAQAQTNPDTENLAIAEAAFDEQDYQKAFEIWQPIADRGNIDAQMALAYAARYCDCVDDGIMIAVKYYHMAAEQGNVEAMRNVGWIYRVKLDDNTEAAIYYKVAADLGDAESQVELGDLYRDGLGGAEPLVQMSGYYHKAAAQGDRAGYARLARLYGTGGPVPADPVKAYVAQSMAAALSFPLAEEEAAEAATKLSAQQLATGNAMVAKCVAAKYLNCL